MSFHSYRVQSNFTHSRASLACLLQSLWDRCHQRSGFNASLWFSLFQIQWSRQPYCSNPTRPPFYLLLNRQPLQSTHLASTQNVSFFFFFVETETVKEKRNLITEHWSESLHLVKCNYQIKKRKMQFVNKAALGVIRGSNDSKCFHPSRRQDSGIYFLVITLQLGNIYFWK